jgi:cobalt-zinc-cadmium resistance protein CzcA
VILETAVSDDFEQLGETAGRIARILRGIRGAADVKVKSTGLPLLDVKLDRSTIARLGLNIADVLDVVSIAVGGREAGLVFQGDRRSFERGAPACLLGQ